jgi:hypothetical protein
MGDEVAGVLLAPLIVGIVEMAKRAGMATRWAPLLAVMLGLVISVWWGVGQGQSGAVAWLGMVLRGLALGLAAVGLYGSGKTVVEGVRRGDTRHAA